MKVYHHKAKGFSSYPTNSTTAPNATQLPSPTLKLSTDPSLFCETQLCAPRRRSVMTKITTYRQHFFKILMRHSHRLNSAIPGHQQRHTSKQHCFITVVTATTLSLSSLHLPTRDGQAELQCKMTHTYRRLTSLRKNHQVTTQPSSKH